jgi:transcriptional regulator with XRE-family HTH domain
MDLDENLDNNVNGKKVRSLFGRNLKRIRLHRNISQLILSAETGLAHNFINDIENSKKWVSAETLAKFCSVLKVEPYQFFIPDEDKEDADKFLSLYLDKMTDSVIKMVNDIKQIYGHFEKP